MFNHECMGELEYESTTMAIAMAGVVISFLIEFVTNRILIARLERAQPPHVDAVEPADSVDKSPSSDDTAISHDPQERLRRIQAKTSVIIMECGIIFHSIREWSQRPQSLPSER